MTSRHDSHQVLKLLPAASDRRDQISLSLGIIDRSDRKSCYGAWSNRTIADALELLAFGRLLR